MSNRITFRKGKRYCGMMRLAETVKVSRNGKEVATIQRSGNAWFWYGDGINTCGTPMTLDEAKADAKKHFTKSSDADGASGGKEGVSK